MLLLGRPDIKLSIEGHTDNRGGAKKNQQLSERRASSVLKWLTQHSIDASRLESHGYGADKPVTTNDTSAGRATNRRVEFRIVKDAGAPPNP